MAEITWDGTGEKVFETGVDRGVLFPRDDKGAYPQGHAWNGLTTVTESPEGAEANPQYADNIKYLNLRSAETLGGTIEAFTYPEAFAKCDGTASPIPGVALGQQPRQPFGFSYRSKVGNDVAGQDYGYKLHLIWGATAAPSEKAYATINDSPEAISFSWEFDTDPVDVPGFAPTSSLTIDSTKVDADNLKALEDVLYGRAAGGTAHLPTPAEVIALLTGETTASVMSATSLEKGETETSDQAEGDTSEVPDSAQEDAGSPAPAE